MKWRFRKRAANAPRIEPRLTPAPVAAAPAAPGNRRTWKAARPDRLAGGFNIWSAPPRADLRQDLRGLVGHARHAAHNGDLARSYEMLVRRHVIGPAGIRLKMRIEDGPGRPDIAANRRIERAWRDWGRMGSPTICGRMSWWGVECAVATAIAREGGAFLRLWRGAGRGKYGLQVEPILFDLLDLDLTRPLAGGGWIESGVECNADGCPVAFHFWNCAQGETHRGLHQRRVRVPAGDIVQIMVPEEIGQNLGIPRSATALRLMNMGEKYEESAMTAANYGAAQMVFFKQSDQSGQLTGPVDTDVPIDEIEAGTVAGLPPGVEPVPFSPNYPEAAVEPFMRHMHTKMAAGLGVAAETLTGDLSRANFSSLRAGKGEERDEWRMLQRAVFESLHDGVFAAWLPMALLSGGIGLPVEKLDKFSDHEWQPRGWQSVNPKDDAAAAQIETGLGLRSLTDIAAERGRDFADIVAERKAERAALEAAGLPMPSLQPGAVMQSPADEAAGSKNGE